MNNSKSLEAAFNKKPYVALKFTQMSDVVTIPSVNVTDQATFEVWINPQKSSPLGYVLFKKSTFAIALQEQELVVAFGNVHPGWKWIHSDWRAPLNEWSHVVVTYDSEQDKICLYINGCLQKTAVVRGALTVCDIPLQFGVKSFKKTGATKTRFFGLLADVRIWDIAMEEDTVKNNWARNLTGNEDHLVGYWALDEGAGSRVVDKSKFEHHGTLVGPNWHMSVAVPAQSLSQAMRKVLANEMSSDVKFKANDGVVLHAHKAILVARCDVFRAMFTGGMKEANMDEIELPDLDGKLLQMLLEYLYTDEVDIPPELAADMFIIADKYRLTRLERMCECVILNTLSTENVCHIFETADTLNAQQLRGIAFRWIIHNFGDVLKSQGYTELDKKLQYEVNIAAASMHFEKATPNAKADVLDTTPSDH